MRETRVRGGGMGGSAGWVLGAAVAAVLAGAGPSADGATLKHYLTFDESNTGTGAAANTGSAATPGTFGGSATRTNGLIGTGAALFNDTAGHVAIGTTGFAMTSGITIEAVIRSNFGGVNVPSYDEIFRKEDGGNRLLFCFQRDGFTTGGPANANVLSFGANIGGYAELDMVLDGGTTPGLAVARPTLAEITTGTHHVAAVYNAATGRKSIFVDGTERHFIQLAANTVLTSVDGGATGTIGNISPLGGEPYNGTIDEVAIWDGALTSAEVAGHWASVQNGDHYNVPEPSAAAVLLGGIVAAVRRGRRR